MPEPSGEPPFNPGDESLYDPDMRVWYVAENGEDYDDD